jgi:hypothetical protein
MTAKNRDHPPPKEKAALAGGDLESNQRQTHFTRSQEKFKWKRALELALDSVLETESGDLGLIQRNLVEAATEMLQVAAEIRRELRQ